MLRLSIGARYRISALLFVIRSGLPPVARMRQISISRASHIPLMK